MVHVYDWTYQQTAAATGLTLAAVTNHVHRGTATEKIPDGWTVMDFADFRFAVPSAWEVPVTAACAQPAQGLVLVPPAASMSRRPAPFFDRCAPRTE